MKSNNNNAYLYMKKIYPLKYWKILCFKDKENVLMKVVIKKNFWTTFLNQNMFYLFNQLLTINLVFNF